MTIGCFLSCGNDWLHGSCKGRFLGIKRMKKHKTILEDGRYLIYYSFDGRRKPRSGRSDSRSRARERAIRKGDR